MLMGHSNSSCVKHKAFACWHSLSLYGMPISICVNAAVLMDGMQPVSETLFPSLIGHSVLLMQGWMKSSQDPQDKALSMPDTSSIQDDVGSEGSGQLAEL